MNATRWLLVLASLLLACDAVPRAVAPAHLSPPPAASSPTSSAATPAVHEERVPAGRLQYRFRASRFSNLFYTVDCLAGTVQCGRDAFDELARTDLGGLDDGDRRALDEWKQLRRAYRGRVQKADEPASPLPLPRAHAQIERRVRLAGYTATDLDQYTALVSMFLDLEDARRAHDILARFAPRFDRYWSTRAERALASRVESFAAAVRAPELRALVDQIAGFYGPELPPGLELTFDLILRPPGKHSNAEQIAHISVIEVEADEPPARSLDVVLHELFHYLLSQVAPDRLVAQMDRFARDPDPIAYAAQGALDEGLASALGNGLVLRTLDRAEFDRRRVRPLGMYADDVIDRMAKAAIGPLEPLLARGDTRVTDPAFEATWVRIAHDAFPAGPPPQALVRPFVGVYPSEFESAVNEIYDLMRVSHSDTHATLDPDATREMFASHPRWTRVLFLRPSDLPGLDRWAHVVAPTIVREVRVLARQKPAFVYAAAASGQPTVFVFVAPDSERLKLLLGRFAAVPVMRPGLVVD